MSPVKPSTMDAACSSSSATPSPDCTRPRLPTRRLPPLPALWSCALSWR